MTPSLRRFQSCVDEMLGISTKKQIPFKVVNFMEAKCMHDSSFYMRWTKFR
jgi:hypothetical protein